MPALKVLLIEHGRHRGGGLERMLLDLGNLVSSTPATEGDIGQVVRARPALDVALLAVYSREALGVERIVRTIQTELEVPVLLCTKSTAPEVLDRAKNADVYGFIALPVKRDHLQSALGLAIRSFQREAALRDTGRLDKRAQQSQKLESLGVLAGGIAHDFNNLLMSILGNADMSLRELSPASPARDMIREIHEAAQHAAELCKQMLAYSGRGRFVIQSLDFNDLIGEMTHLLDASVPEGVTLHLALSDGLPPVQGDVTQLRQIVMNLFSNAREALGDEQGEITISTRAIDCDREYLSSTYLDEDLPAGAYVALAIGDTGCGMRTEEQNRIFDPFYSTKFTGRGLGLPAVLGVVRGHNGAIKVDSEPGEGSTFTVLFPEAELPAEQLPAKLVDAPGWRGTGVVLVVDDEELVRSVTKRILERMGFSVLAARDGREGIQVFEEHRGEIAVVLLDLTMPRMSGEETYRELRRISQTVPVILSSGYDAMQAAERFTADGLAGFIQKPYRSKDLCAKLRTALTLAM